MPTNNEEFLKYLSQLIEATQSGKMRWAKENPTTFTWTTNSPRPAKIILQKIDRQNRVRDSIGRLLVNTTSSFVFQVIEPNTNIQKLYSDDPNDAELQKNLEVLYRSIQNSIAQAGLDFLKSILPDG